MPSPLAAVSHDEADGQPPAYLCTAGPALGQHLANLSRGKTAAIAGAMDHDTKQPRKRALRLAGLRQKLNNDNAPTWRQDMQTLPQDLAAGLLRVIVENMAEKHHIIGTTKLHGAQIATERLHPLRHPQLRGILLGDG